MNQITKLYAQLVSTRAAMRFADFERVLKAFGFTLECISGSHHIYKHPDVPRRLSIQPRGGRAKPYQIEQFLDMIEQLGLEMNK